MPILSVSHFDAVLGKEKSVISPPTEPREHLSTHKACISAAPSSARLDVGIAHIQGAVSKGSGAATASFASLSVESALSCIVLEAP